MNKLPPFSARRIQLIHDINDPQITVNLYSLACLDLLGLFKAASHTGNAVFPSHDDGVGQRAPTIGYESLNKNKITTAKGGGL